MYNPPPLGDSLPAVPAYIAPRRRMSRRARIGWIAGVAAALLVIAAAVFVHVSANTAFDDAAARLDGTIADAAEVEAALSDAVAESADAVAVAEDIVTAAADDLVDPAARVALGATTAESANALALADEALAAPIGTPEDKPVWTWEILGLTPEIDDRTADTADAATAMTAAQESLSAADEALSDAATALFASVPAAADALEAANISAQAVLVLDFRDAAEAAAGQDRLGSGAAVAFSTLATAAQTLKASQATELAEKQGPLLATRLEIEEYARSIAGGVVLDFDWQQTVAGTGGSQGIGGTATWNTIRGGFSTITLSHSVAEWWPNADSRALVAHEVGHSITSKCWEKFDSESQAANEEWATAWAISLGHTAEGNGVQAYGYPSQEMIEIASTCR
ncbi:hypothetical protein QL996_02505 [Planococcus sp. APC 4015]|nr:hypothetical protein [Planococcus sp. APC 4015]